MVMGKHRGLFLQKSKTFFMTFAAVFSYKKNCHGMLFEIKLCRVSASKLSMCYFHIIHTKDIKNNVLFSTF
jgi:hypothetical protein